MPGPVFSLRGTYISNATTPEHAICPVHAQSVSITTARARSSRKWWSSVTSYRQEAAGGGISPGFKFQEFDISELSMPIYGPAKATSPYAGIPAFAHVSSLVDLYPHGQGYR